MLLERASSMIDNGRTGAAGPLLTALRGKVAETKLARLVARLMVSEGRFSEAVDELDRAIAKTPGDKALHKQRARLRLQLNDLPQAAADAADAVILDQDDHEAKALLGSVLIRLGRGKDAAACLGEALAARPCDVAIRITTAQAQALSGDDAAAAATLADGVAATPQHGGLQEAFLLSLVRAGNWQKALRAAEDAARHGALGPVGFGIMGHALASLDRHAEAAEAYQEAYKLAPEDPYIRHLYAASAVLRAGRHPSPDDLRDMFDNYAQRFERDLIRLGYRLPGAIRALLLADQSGDGLGKDLGPVLDLGCGTGLIGVALGDLPVRPLTGVDVSAGMLDHAERKHVYDHLIQANLTQFLRADGPCWPLIIAADVCCYMGRLDEVLPLIAGRLAPGGRVLFSVELLPPQDDGVSFRFGRNARFAHTRAYIAEVVAKAGLVDADLRPEMIRREVGKPVDGLLVVARRSG